MYTTNDMKTMTCKQLDGACDMQIEAETFEELSKIGKKHALQMIGRGDLAHIIKMQAMMKVMKKPEAFQKWLDEKRKEFDALPEDLHD